jgi:hypothetical protein
MAPALLLLKSIDCVVLTGLLLTRLNQPRFRCLAINHCLQVGALAVFHCGNGLVEREG